MQTAKKRKYVIIDTSAILSGKPINLYDVNLITTQSVSDELKPGGRDYNSFQLLKEKGLSIFSPSKKSIETIQDISKKTGDYGRLSKADIDLLALAFDMSKNKDVEITILSDDYAIQNIADFLQINFENINQPGITKRFKWICICRGCRKKFKENISICPICGSQTKKSVSHISRIEKNK